jgi:hypothetical protein
MLPWLIAHAFGYFLVVASVLTIYFTNNRLRCLFGMDNVWGEPQFCVRILLILLTQFYWFVLSFVHSNFIWHSMLCIGHVYVVCGS